MKDTEDDTKQATQDESHIQIDTGQFENPVSNNTEKQDNTKLVCSEIVVKIDESFQDTATSKRDVNKDVNERHGQNWKLPTTLVYYQLGGSTIPNNGGPPLSYTRDRNSFVRLVFLILFIMIASTAAFNVLVEISEVLHDFFEDYGIYLVIAASVLMMGLSYAMTLSSCTRVMPCNIICLFLAVIGMSILCCFITIRYDTRIVMLAVAATAGVVLLCFGLACTSFDFTSWLLYVVVICGAFGILTMAVAIYTVITGHYMKTLHIVILVVGTIISVVILTIELQMVLGGKAVELSEDDYALGAFLLYTSILDIFIKLVQLLGTVMDPDSF